MIWRKILHKSRALVKSRIKLRRGTVRCALSANAIPPKLVACRDSPCNPELSLDGQAIETVERHPAARPARAMTDVFSFANTFVAQKRLYPTGINFSPVTLCQCGHAFRPVLCVLFGQSAVDEE